MHKIDAYLQKIDEYINSLENLAYEVFKKKEKNEKIPEEFITSVTLEVIKKTTDITYIISKLSDHVDVDDKLLRIIIRKFAEAIGFANLIIDMLEA